MADPTPRLVATDLDGTLLQPDGTLSARTREVLTALEARAIPVVFVTGRPMRWMEDLWGEVGGVGLAVCSNGGIVYDVARHTIRHASVIDRADALQVADLLRQAMPGTAFALEKTGGYAREREYRGQHREPPGIAVGPLEEIFDDTVVKLLATHPEAAPEAYWREASDLIGPLLEVTWSSSWSLLEMSAPGITKASSLAGLCAELGVAASEVVAFGDMPNDVPMLEWAGLPVAMADAHPSAMRSSVLVAPTNTEDGVATVLTDLFGL